ncbi:MAG: hypothetical protein HDR48_01085 [Bacteroides sp.]|nr:hypothetical protein [Bacteroides sp.]
MMRNSSKAILSGAALALVMASGVMASAQSQSGWKAIGRSTSSTVTPAGVEEVSLSRIVRGKGKPIGKSLPSSRNGEYRTPKISQQPSNRLASPEEPRAQLYGVINRYPEMVVRGDAFVAQFDLKTGKMTKKYQGAQFCPFSGDDYVFQTDVYRDGKIYTPASTSSANGPICYWNVSDFYSGELLETVNSNSDQVPYTMCYNSDEDVFYAVGIALTGTQEAGALLRIDPNDNFSTIVLGDVTNDWRLPWVSAVTYNPNDKKMYFFCCDNSIYTLEERNGDFRMIENGFVDTDLMLFEEYATGQCVYSPADQAFIAVYRDNVLQANRICYIDPDTFELTEGVLVAQREKPYIASLLISDAYADANAPEMINDVKTNFPGVELSGSVSFTAPKYTYIGVELGNSPIRAVATIDGKEVYNKSVAPGQTVTFDATLTEGVHVLEVCSFTTVNGEELQSPVRKIEFYTGYDAPVAPSDLTLKGTELSWEAPLAGQHGGVVDMEDITYNVYLNGVKQNEEPIKGTTFTLTAPAVQDVCDIAVEAVSRTHASVLGSISEVFGKAMELPFLQEPTRAEKDMYRVINSNKDDRSFYWTDSRDMSGEDSYGYCMVVGYTNDADDWLILPLMNFPSSEYLYSLDFDLAGVMDGETLESYELYLAKEPTVSSMLNGLCIYKDNNYRTDHYFKHHSYNFAVKEAGEYYIGIRVNSRKETDPSGQGLLFNDFNVKVVEGKTTAIPADPTDVKIIPDAEGYDEFEVVATLPTLDIVGKTLDPNKDITLTVTVDGRAQSATGKPGQTVTVEQGTMGPGFANIQIVPSNENGAGYTRTYRSYIGIDIPLCPTDIKATASADNLTMHYTWKAPGTIGENNGVVRLDELFYKFYVRTGGTSISYIDQTTETHYDYTPSNDKSYTQHATLAGPSANTIAGESRSSIFYQDEIGVPYELPLKEEFNTAKFDYEPYRYLVDGDCSGSEVENVGSMTGVGIGDPTIIQGAIIAYSSAYPCDTRFVLPKVITEGIARTVFSVRVWDYAEAPEAVQIYGRRYAAEEEVFIDEYKFNHPAKGEWVDLEFNLPEEYNNCPWIQVRVGAPMKGSVNYPNEYLVIDNYQFYPDIDFDMKLTTLNGATTATPGETVKYKVAVANSGRERSNGTLIVEATDENGKVLSSSEVKLPMLTSAQYYEHEVEFELTGEFAAYKSFNVVARVEAPMDDNLRNNSKTLTVEVKDSSLPVVTDLKGESANGAAELTWTRPTGTYGDYENFENEEPFQITDQIGRLKIYNLDDLYPIGLENGSLKLQWPGYEKKQAWTVLDMSDLNGVSFMGDQRLAPHSGKNVMIARAGWYDEENDAPKQSSKWFVLPELESGSTVSFWFTTPNEGYTEYIELWTSTTGDYIDPNFDGSTTRNGNFRRFRSFSKYGADAWEPVKYTLTASEKYVAFRYCSFDGLAMLIDDLSFTPVEKLEYDVVSYNVYRVENDGEPTLIAENLTTPSYKDADYDASKHVIYFVRANANHNGKVVEGSKSNLVHLGETGVDNVAGAASIIGGKGEIRLNGYADESVVIAAADGKVVVNGKVRADQAHYSVAPGVYVVTCGKDSVKVVVR